MEKILGLDDFQAMCLRTCPPITSGINMVLGLCGETGKICIKPCKGCIWSIYVKNEVAHQARLVVLDVFSLGCLSFWANVEYAQVVGTVGLMR